MSEEDSKLQMPDQAHTTHRHQTIHLPTCLLAPSICSLWPFLPKSVREEEWLRAWAGQADVCPQGRHLFPSTQNYLQTAAGSTRSHA